MALYTAQELKAVVDGSTESITRLRTFFQHFFRDLPKDSPVDAADLMRYPNMGRRTIQDLNRLLEAQGKEAITEDRNLCTHCGQRLPPSMRT